MKLSQLLVPQWDPISVAENFDVGFALGWFFRRKGMNSGEKGG